MTSEILPSGFSEVRFRFAPSPTGYLHVGGARTALFNYLFAKSYNGTFILRIEDTDQTRSTQKATDQVLESMHWLGIDWDEGPDISSASSSDSSKGSYGPYYQAKRLDIYQSKLEELINAKKVYPCFCSDEELEQKRKQAEAMGVPYTYDRRCLSLSSEEVESKKNTTEKWVYRFKVDVPEIIFNDEIKGRIKFDTKLIGDFVIRKSDGFPTYNFAVVVDDSSMKISHVLRGDDHISNTPRQIMIYQALNQPIPKFYHISMILSKDGDKLSKRHGAVSVLDYKDAGYYQDPLLNHLALLGWSPEDGVEVIPREKLLSAFINPKFSSSPAIFDENKLDYLNGLYLRNLPDEVILEDLKNELEKNPANQAALQNQKIDEILLQLKNYCKKLTDINVHIARFFSTETNPALTDADNEWLKSETSQKLFELAHSTFSQENQEFIQNEEFKKLMEVAKTENIKGKNFFMPLRLKLTGEAHGLELDVFLSLKPRNEILALLKV